MQKIQNVCNNFITTQTVIADFIFQHFGLGKYIIGGVATYNAAKLPREGGGGGK